MIPMSSGGGQPRNVHGNVVFEPATHAGDTL